jgi:threonine dehydrogenase-like Zn-dependent dehydrogenase
LGARADFARAQIGDLLAALGPDLANAVISTSNAWADWTLALQSAGERGTIAVLGFPGRGTTGIPLNPLDSQYFYQKQLSILAAGLVPERPDSRGFLPYNERRNLATILEWIRRGELLPAALIAGVLPGDRIEEAYVRLLSGAGAPGTLLLQWSEGSPGRG